jgi:hypothetical protein
VCIILAKQARGFDMPISMEMFEANIDIDTSEYQKRADKTMNQILEVFTRNPDQAFTANEVAKAIGLPLGKAVGALAGPAMGAYLTLQSMVKDGAVDKKTIGRETYYRINTRSAPRLS